MVNLLSCNFKHPPFWKLTQARSSGQRGHIKTNMAVLMQVTGCILCIFFLTVVYMPFLNFAHISTSLKNVKKINSYIKVRSGPLGLWVMGWVLVLLFALVVFPWTYWGFFSTYFLFSPRVKLNAWNPVITNISILCRWSRLVLWLQGDGFPVKLHCWWLVSTCISLLGVGSQWILWHSLKVISNKHDSLCSTYTTSVICFMASHSSHVTDLCQ